jgi:hypothetical protein
MPSATLAFSNYRFVGAEIIPSTIVGADPWDDISDADYTETHTADTAVTSVIPRAVADFPATSIGGALVGIDITAHVVLSNTGGAADSVFLIELWDTGGNGVAFMFTDASGMLMVPADGTEYVVGSINLPFDYDSFTPIEAAALTSLFQSGGSLAIYRLEADAATIPNDHIIRVNYVSMTITWRGGMPPLRRRQRDDHLGNSARRKSTSRQRSLRNTGYL